MQAMSSHFQLIYVIFIDIVYKNIVFLAVNLIIYDWKPNKLEVGTNLVEAACLRRCLEKANIPKFGVVTRFEGFIFGLGGVGALDDCLSDVDSAGLVFAEPVERLIDQAGTWRATVYKGEIAFLNFTSLLHFSKEGGVLFAPCYQEKAAGFTVESADKGKKLIRVLVAEPVDEGKGPIGAGGVNKPSGRFIDDQERGML